MEKSYLFVPGIHIGRVNKAIASAADAVIIDLEDSVAISEKEYARECIELVLTQTENIAKQVYVRINDRKTAFWEKDAKVLANYPTIGVMLPKTESAEDIFVLNKQLSPGQKIIPLIETASGVMSAYEIASAAKNIVRLAFGAIDYCLDIGVSLTTTQEELIYPRSNLVIASKAAGIASPIDKVFTELGNNNGLIEETKRALQLGLFAKLCIHPEQLSVVNQLFQPTKEEIAWAKEVIQTFEQAEECGQGAIKLNDKMIDYPVYKKALSIIEGIS